MPSQIQSICYYSAVLWDPELHYSVHNTASLVTTSYFSKIRFNIISPSLNFPNGYTYSGFLMKILYALLTSPEVHSGTNKKNATCIISCKVSGCLSLSQTEFNSVFDNSSFCAKSVHSTSTHSQHKNTQYSCCL